MSDAFIRAEKLFYATAEYLGISRIDADKLNSSIKPLADLDVHWYVNSVEVGVGLVNANMHIGIDEKCSIPGVEITPKTLFYCGVRHDIGKNSFDKLFAQLFGKNQNPAMSDRMRTHIEHGFYMLFDNGSFLDAVNSYFHHKHQNKGLGSYPLTIPEDISVKLNSIFPEIYRAGYEMSKYTCIVDALQSIDRGAEIHTFNGEKAGSALIESHTSISAETVGFVKFDLCTPKLFLSPQEFEREF